MYESETWAALSTVMERLDCAERKLLRRLLGYLWPRMYLRMTRYAEYGIATSGAALAVDREGWAELCSKAKHLSEDANSCVKRRHELAD
ncbi:hypothetical protein RB195_000837 [Necator americanus]|uniref:Uncharacterized protein n=1 Tax=Necator americanus TaxID=51031 RepID=A0ABR1DBP4_NECAM